MAEARNEEGDGKFASVTAGSEDVTKEKLDLSSKNCLADTNDPLVKALHSLLQFYRRRAGRAAGIDDNRQLPGAVLLPQYLKCSNSEYELLKDMNLRTAEEYDNYCDFASGLRIFVERLKHKNETFNHYLQEIDSLDHQVTEVEAIVSTLDNYTNT